VCHASLPEREDAVDLNLNIGVLDGFGIVVNQSE
jgi:hypothetical protein